ncbi:rRNA biogenesis protein RRP5, putative [Talaromyces stipitatus ATCC 10500]|uniref:rRNA biogenesis protein RRP5 n=1 Tax=Talaromyces stipitatus (strain ATCC 10500 / CBS 375.48 / QM 6759 / NRRL 1006) TaxID=441959 RepID=B8MQ07_TALSN|nr:rRNA biogenesis protein RRP5, putative [Talaromyces stipitatus ATCC 10500]EED12897.1 rRNA biogenesis protein RRP5, putative [Talaromyces stipitatus ATCC 10500]
MAPIKRKGTTGDDSATKNQKRARVSSDAVKAGSQSKKSKQSKDTAEETTSRDAAVSVLRNEESSFPRGGGSVLTPLERKQIQIQATRDVLFEQKRSGKSTEGLDDGISDEDIDMQDEGKKPATTKKSRKSKNKKSRDSEKKTKEGVRVEGLSFKRLTIGTMVLGQVTSINSHDIGLALPNNLTGYVPLTAISEVFDKKIENVLNAEDENEDDDSEEDSLDPSDYFYVGQYLRAYVTSTGSSAVEAGTAKIKKKIELSLDPRQANTGLSESDLVEGAMVQASVASIEDHGCVMDIGLGKKGAKGFMASTDEAIQSNIKEGAVLLCIVTGVNASRTIFQLSSKLQTAASPKSVLKSAPTIQTFLPGTAAEILLTSVTETGLVGKIMGLLDATVDFVHSGANSGSFNLTTKYQLGAKIKARITCTFPAAEPFKVGASVLENILEWRRTPSTQEVSSPSIGTILDARVTTVEPGLGLYVEFGSLKHLGFVHISRVADGTVESISAEQGAFKTGSTHKARIIGHNSVDNLYLLSFEKKVIDQPYIRLEDVPLGEVVKGKIEKLLIGPEGIDGLILSIADGITGLVPSMHFADTVLQHPEKKFREGLAISARVLSVNLEKRQMRLTLKKSLLNSDSAIWKDYNDIVPGQQSPGTLINIQPNGATVQFYGTVRGFLPVSEMSEAYIKDPSQHFRKGQVVNVHAISVDISSDKLVVSCKDPSTSSEAYREAFSEIRPGVSVTGTVFEKSSDDLLLKLDKYGVTARLSAVHLVDGDASKAASAFAKIRVGQKLSDLLVLEAKRVHRLIKVTHKPSLRKALKKNSLPSTFEELEVGTEVTGFVRGTTSHGVFVEFLGGLNGLLPRRLVDDEHSNMPDFGFYPSQALTATIHQIDEDHRRFTLTMRPVELPTASRQAQSKERPLPEDEKPVNPVDESIQTVAEYTVGKVTKARILSIKETQINVVLADNLQGRIDVSEVFDKWEDIKDRKQPLQKFRVKEILPVRILGLHDARSHRFLPISHRTSKHPVYELSAKPSFITAGERKPLSLEQVKVGSSMIGFVNNINDDYLWISLSPNVRGRVRAIDLSDDLSTLTDLESNYPMGSALKVRVTGVDSDKGHLDLSVKSGSTRELSFDKLSKGMILPGRVTKVTEKQIIMQLSDSLVGAVTITDMADDYSKIDTSIYKKNEILRACIIDVDKSNKKIFLSLRPSKVLSSTLPVRDREITSIDQLKVNDIVRGFVRKVADNGLFVTLGHSVSAYVRISDLSDSYLKEWKDEFQADQLVKGRIIFVDQENKRLQMSLKESVLDSNYKTPITIRDLKPGQIVTGKVRKVEDFGAFIVIDRSANVSGLCHRSQMAEQNIDDARKLFEAGDIVKAKILKIDPKQEKISFGLKASYFKDEEGLDSEEGSDEDLSMDEAGGVELHSDDSGEDMSIGGVEIEDGSDDESESSDDDEDVTTADERAQNDKGGLDVGDFDWTGDAGLSSTSKITDGKAVGEEASNKKKRIRKPEIQVDQTGDLDARGPQSVADYERLLLGEPDSSLLWLQYMAFQLELGEVDKAREIGQRAIRSISIGQDTEKLNIWVALLNLENTYGTDDSLEEVFKKACQYNDTQEIYERLISIYIQSGKNEKADELFQTALKKKVYSGQKFFINYATFLFDTLANPDRGRDLFPRALQSLPSNTHVDTTCKFIQLEFRSPNGDVERGRTLFEGLLSSFPKRTDLWNILLDLEIKQGDADQVRSVFQRVLGISTVLKKKGAVPTPASTETQKKLKPKKARFFFKKWLDFEEKLAAAEGGNEKMVEEVKARAADYVNSLQES